MNWVKQCHWGKGGIRETFFDCMCPALSTQYCTSYHHCFLCLISVDSERMYQHVSSFFVMKFLSTRIHAREHRGRCHEKNEESYRHTATCCLVHMQAQTFIMKWFMNRISLWFLPSVCSKYTHRS